MNNKCYWHFCHHWVDSTHCWAFLLKICLCSLTFSRSPWNLSFMHHKINPYLLASSKCAVIVSPPLHAVCFVTILFCTRSLAYSDVFFVGLPWFIYYMFEIMTYGTTQSAAERMASTWAESRGVLCGGRSRSLLPALLAIHWPQENYYLFSSNPLPTCVCSQCDVQFWFG